MISGRDAQVMDLVEARRSRQQRTGPAVAPSVAAVLALQRSAGNAAVTRILLQRSPSATASPARAGEVWPGGPITKRKSRLHTLSEYVGWVREVEAAYRGREGVLHRLRKLYYSDFAGGTVGARFDTIVADIGPDASPPLQSPPLSTAALDGLFETDAIVTPGGQSVDISHVFAGMDVSTFGTGLKAEGAEVLYGVDMQGVLTWTGDLASWWVQYVADKTNGVGPPDPNQHLEQIVAKKVSKDDLLGDMDAQALAAMHVGPPRWPIQDLPTNVLDEDVSTVLELSYDPAHNPYGGPVVGKGTETLARFARFVRGARPVIPHTEAGGKTQLADDSFEAIYNAVKNTAELFVKKGSAGTAADLITYDDILHTVTAYFHNFLERGLSDGDAPWPS